MLMPKRPSPIRLHQQRTDPALVIREVDDLTPAQRLLDELVQNDRHLREYVQRRASRSGLTVSELLHGKVRSGAHGRRPG